MDAKKIYITLGALIAILATVASISASWAGQVGELRSQDTRITKLENAVQNMRDTLNEVNKSNVALQVGLDNLSDKIS